MNDLVTTTSGNALAAKTTGSLVARGLGRLGELPQKDLDFEMGHNHLEGINGYEQSDALAIEYFKKSASKNNYEAMCDLAMLTSYHILCGCQHDDKHICGLDELEGFENRMTEAVGWLHKAALAGHARAQYELPGSWCYCDDDTVCDNIVSCLQDTMQWTVKAAAQNYPPALFKLGLKAEIEAEAKAYFARLEKLNSNDLVFLESIFDLACFHTNGKRSTYKCASSFKQDPSKGIDLHTRIGKQGFHRSQRVLAEYYFTNRSSSNYAEMAFYWCRIAAENSGFFEAVLLAKCYENGVGTQIDLDAALALYQKFSTDRVHGKVANEKINELNHLLWHKNI